jgi:hypothetical protein
MTIARRRLNTVVRELREAELDLKELDAIYAFREAIDFADSVEGLFNKVYNDCNHNAGVMMTKEIYDFVIRSTSFIRSKFYDSVSQQYSAMLLSLMDCCGELTMRFSGPEMDSVILAAVKTSLSEEPALLFEIISAASITNPVNIYRELIKGSEKNIHIARRWLEDHFYELQKFSVLK